MIILERLKNENARAFALRVLVENIVGVEMEPGSAVSENELSQEMELSRTPVREALIELDKLGLVKIVPQKGSYIEKIDYEKIEDAQFLRLSVETAVIKRACEVGISDEYLLLLKNNLEEQKVCASSGSDAKKMIMLDNEFHRLMFESVGKERVYDMLHTQMLHFDRLRCLTMKTFKNKKNDQTIKDHANLIYAIEQNDGELGEMLIKRHLERHRLEEKKQLMDRCPRYFETEK